MDVRHGVITFEQGQYFVVETGTPNKHPLTSIKGENEGEFASPSRIIAFKLEEGGNVKKWTDWYSPQKLDLA